MPVYITEKVIETVTRKGQAMLHITKIIFTATPADVRVCPHLKDASKLVLKSVHPGCPAAFCAAFDIEPGNQWKGSNYFIMEVDKAELVASFGKMSQALQAHAKALPAPESCPECGGDNGNHWGHCPQHYENKALN